MVDKTCPTCTKDWADDFRFCPEDGTPLVAVAAVAATQDDVNARNAATVVQMPAIARVTPTRVVAVPTPAAPAKPAEVEAPSKAAVASKPEKPKKNFSETAWFMQKIEPSMIDPKTGRVMADTSKAPAEELDAETRKRYSLRTEEDEE